MKRAFLILFLISALCIKAEFSLMLYVLASPNLEEGIIENLAELTYQPLPNDVRILMQVDWGMSSLTGIC